MLPVLLVVGTRPEGIKMVPVYLALKQAGIPVVLCSTDQHSTLLHEVFETFNVTPDIHCSIMKPGQDLSYITCAVLEHMKSIYARICPSLVLVQGDTTTVMAAAMAAFYARIPVGHVEAGLRTGDIYSPYPEEANRCIVGVLANYHFAPTELAVKNLLAEGKPQEQIYLTGNTVVDALRLVEHKIATGMLHIRSELVAAIAQATAAGHKKIVVTVHRRESFPDGIMRIFNALKTYVQAFPNTTIIYPFHPNPAVTKAIEESGLRHEKNIIVMPAVVYHELIYLLHEADCVATDSGGIQEEAISLGKHVLVLREKTERMEGVYERLATVVGTDEEKIMSGLQNIFKTKNEQITRRLIYGDGFAADKIVTIIQSLGAPHGHNGFLQKIV